MKHRYWFLLAGMLLCIPGSAYAFAAGDLMGVKGVRSHLLPGAA